MRLRRLLLEHYGNFEHVELLLDPAPGCINLIEAPNGTGKSVLRQAFHDLLFGIADKTPFRFDRFKGERPHLLADAVLQDGEGLTFGTRYKQGRVLPEGVPNATIRLSGALSRVTPHQLQHLFALDTHRLREGGEELASGGDTLGLALLAGTGELTFAKSVRTGLQAKRDAIWEPGTRSKPLHKANKAVEDARKSLRNAIRQPKQRQAELAEFETHQTTLRQAREDHAAASETARRLARIDRTRAALADLADAQAWLAANADAPALPPDLDRQLADARGEATLAGAKLAGAERQASERRSTVAGLFRDGQAIEAEAKLGRLAERLGEVEKGAADSRGLAGQRERLTAEIAATLQALGCASETDPASLLPPAAAIATTRDLITRHAARLRALEDGEDRCREAREVLERLTADEASAQAADVSALAALLLEIRGDGEPARRLAEAARALRAAETASAIALADIPGWAGEPSALAALPTLAEPVMERLAIAVTTTERKAAEARADQDRMDRERAAQLAELNALQTTPLPDQAAIARERAARDAGWQLVFQHAFTPTPPDPAVEAAYTQGEPLPLRFERHMREADALADRRLLELPRVTEAGRLARTLAGSERVWEALVKALAQAEAEAAGARAAWAAACSQAGARPDSTAAELRAFGIARTEALRAAAAVTIPRGDHDAVLSRHSDWAARLRLTLGVPEGQLPALLAAADAQLAVSAEAERKRIQHHTQRTDAQTRLRREEAAYGKARAAMVDWQADWALSLTSLGRPAHEAPAATDAVLRSLETLKLQVQDHRGLSDRLDAMHDDGRHFTDDVVQLAAELGEAPGLDAFATARLLITRREKAQQANAAWQQAEAARLGAEAALTQESDAARQAADVLKAIVAACGAVDSAEAEQRLVRSNERRRHHEMRDRAETVLRDHGDGLPHATLREQAAGAVEPHRMAAEREAATKAMDDARNRSEHAAVTVNQAEQLLSVAARSQDALTAAAASMAASAAQSRLLDDFLLLGLASVMLDRALTKVEETAGGTGLRRISAAFEALTHGAYAIEGGEIKGGQTVLRAIEARFPHERRNIAELSEGTRDQLYLALRLVAIEDFVSASPPLPFIADDILQTFDDTRARAAMEALVGLSQHVQVIVLTHHPHLLEVAKGLPIHVQRL